MRKSGLYVGIGLVVAGFVVTLLVSIWLGIGLASSDLEAGGAMLGGIVAFLFLVAPLLGVGGFLIVRSRAEAREYDRVTVQRRMIGRIEAAGEISVADLALESGLSREEVRDNLVDLVSKGLFSGYVDWNRGQLFARQASQLREMQYCQSCGSQLELAGHGLIRCPYCGTEYFLP